MTKQLARHQKNASKMSTDMRIKNAIGYLKESAMASGMDRKEYETRMAGAGLVYVDGINTPEANKVRASLQSVINKWN